MKIHWVKLLLAWAKRRKKIRRPKARRNKNIRRPKRKIHPEASPGLGKQIRKHKKNACLSKTQFSFENKIFPSKARFPIENKIVPSKTRFSFEHNMFPSQTRFSFEDMIFPSKTRFFFRKHDSSQQLSYPIPS